MLDIKLFRERPEELSKALAARYGVFPVEGSSGWTPGAGKCSPSPTT